MEDILLRFHPTFPATVSCDEGWFPLIERLHNDILKIDPDYKIYQIKEKFGGLRYYYSPSNPSQRDKMDAIVSKYEKICGMTCEVTGKHGSLMRNGTKPFSRVKTLNESFINEGWELPTNDDTVPNCE